MQSVYTSDFRSLLKILRHGILLALIAILPGTAFAATYTATASGNWSSTTTWGGNPAPGSTIGASDVVNINGFNVVYNLANDLIINGQLNITGNGKLTTTDRNIIVGSTGQLTITNSELIMTIPGSGNLRNQDGTILVTNSLVQVAQNWEDDSSSGGERTFIGGLPESGEKMPRIKNPWTLYDGACIEIATKSSGNWENHHPQTLKHGTTLRIINSGHFVNQSQIIGSGAAPHLSALGVTTGNLDNDGSWSAKVLNFALRW
ncbi:MAG: hypothetical protein IPM98_20285 [Lewinellaceae bacterium]|nr:hypothetical protein [Lewinellaceae bacterium]